MLMLRSNPGPVEAGHSTGAAAGKTKARQCRAFGWCGAGTRPTGTGRSGGPAGAACQNPLTFRRPPVDTLLVSEVVGVAEFRIAALTCAAEADGFWAL